MTEAAEFRSRITRLQEQLRSWFPGEGSEEAAEDLSVVLEELEVAAEQLAARSEDMRASREDIQQERERWHQLFEFAPDAYVVTNASGFILEANREARRLLGLAQRALPSPLVAHLAQDSRLPYMRLLRLPPATVEPQPVVVRVRSPSHVGFRGELRRGHIGGNEYLWLFRDVTVMEQARQRLEEAFDQERKLSEQLKDFDELREAFLLAVAHDLKAPLAAISAFAELLRRGRLDDVQRHSVVERLEETAAGTTRLLDDLLDYQRVTYGVTPISREKVELETLIREAAGGIPAGGHQLVYDVSPVTASLDAALTRRIVANLVTNAIKHTPAECTVWVRCRREPDGILLVVEDDGPGVPPERRTAIFDVFERDPVSASGGRLGVGLALVARFAGLHGGYARVEERPGGGASFQVVLPDAAS